MGLGNDWQHHWHFRKPQPNTWKKGTQRMCICNQCHSCHLWAPLGSPTNLVQGHWETKSHLEKGLFSCPISSLASTGSALPKCWSRGMGQEGLRYSGLAN